MAGDGIRDADLEQPESEVAEADYAWHYLQLQTILKQKNGGSKNAQCMFCDRSFIRCSTARAAAHILARLVMNQMDDDRRGSLRKAQKTRAMPSVLKSNPYKERNRDSK